MSRKRILVLLGLAICAGQVAQAQTQLCVPIANGVPGTVMWQKPPNWWDPAPGAPLYNPALDAPAWRGAAGASFPAGGAGTDHVHFRALHRNEGGTEYLYLSWWGKVLPIAASTQNELYVGFGGPSDIAGAQDVLLKISITGTTDTGTRAAPQPSATHYTASVQVKAVGSADSAWTNYTGSPSVPAWLTGTGRVWMFEAGAPPSSSTALWAFQVRIPVTNSNDLNNGVRITSPYKHWFEFRAANASGYTPYKWPRTAPDMIFSAPAPMGDWRDARLTSGTPESPDPKCPVEGVKLLSSNIGSLNADPRSINLLTPNTFFATPSNGMPGAGSVSLTATFRLANWGTGATWEDVTNPNANLWTPVATSLPTAVPNGGATQITAAYTATACERCQYPIHYAANSATCDATCPATTNNTKRNHQCLLVQLSGTGVDFINDSAYNNMNFANTSTFTEEAEINLAGLPQTAPGSLARDVYIFVQKSRMPSNTNAGGGGPRSPGGVPRAAVGQPGVNNNPPVPAAGVPVPANCLPSGITDPNVPREQRQAAIVKGLASGAFTYEDLQQQIPTVIYHAYYDTGKPAAGGKVVLRPLNPFGYFPMHDGEAAGWEALLENAELIAPDWYRVRVGPTGIATVRARITAKDSLGGGVRLFADVGLNFPHGSLSETTDGNVSINGGLEYLLPNNFSIEGSFGYHGFDADQKILQFTGQLKRYFTAPNGRTHVFGAGGLGMYRLDPDNTLEVGVNLGGGVLHDVTPRLGVEGVYYLHSINTADAWTRFSTLQVGLRVRF